MCTGEDRDLTTKITTHMHVNLLNCVVLMIISNTMNIIGSTIKRLREATPPQNGHGHILLNLFMNCHTC